MKKASSSRLRADYPIMVQGGLLRQLEGGQLLVYQGHCDDKNQASLPSPQVSLDEHIMRFFLYWLLLIYEAHEAHDPLGPITICQLDVLQ
jgi:hypothetical protein